MSQSDKQAVQDYLQILGAYEGPKSQGVNGFHAYYENAGYAADCIEQMGPRAVESLIMALDDANERVRHYAAYLLGKVGDGRAITPLQTRLATEPNERIRTIVERSLALLSELDRQQPLAKRLQSPEIKVRKDTVNQLAFQSNTSAALLLVRALKDEHPAIRIQTADAIGAFQTKNPDVVPYLIDVVQNDPIIQVRIAAIDALLRNRSGDARIPLALNNNLAITLSHPRTDIRCKALQTLGDVPLRTAKVPLEKHLTRTDLPDAERELAERILSVIPE